MGSIAGIEPVHLREHGNGGSGGKRGLHRGKEHHVVRQPEELAEHADHERDGQQLHGRKVVDLARAEDLLRCPRGKECSRDEQGDGGAEVGEVHHELGEKGGESEAGEGDGQHIDQDADEAGNRAEIDEDLAHRQLDIRALARENGNAPGPDEEVKADVVEGRQKQALRPEERLHDGKSDEPAIGEHEGELGDLALVQIPKALAEKKSDHAQERMQDHAETDVDKAIGQILIGEFRLGQSRDDHHGLADLDDECREPLGGHVVNDAPFAGKKAAGHEQKQGGNDREEC